MTIHVMIRYTVKEGLADANVAAVAAFIGEAKAAADGSYEYTSLQTGDLDFVHLGRFADEEAIKRFQALPGFKGFAQGLGERAAEGPSASRPALVASTRD